MSQAHRMADLMRQDLGEVCRVLHERIGAGEHDEAVNGFVKVISDHVAAACPSRGERFSFREVAAAAQHVTRAANVVVMIMELNAQKSVPILNIGSGHTEALDASKDI